ncbi:MAG: hypothetical protein KDA27_28630, partial [Candidatus Eisenbacteria bacterium]|nr:hypothetical protein [Candidatus Eisenbacteria bacterium]
SWLRLHVGTPEIGAQRLGPDGAVWWGSDGCLLWSGYSLHFHDPIAVGDVIGGAFVVMSSQGYAIAQHVDPWGSVQWASGGIVIQDSLSPYPALSTHPVICDDGAFGFIIAHGNEDLYAQRLDYWGNVLWGSGIPLGHRAGRQARPSLVRDGASGAVVVWQDLYWALPDQPWHVLTGMRLDATGSSVWGPIDLYSWWRTYDPHDPRLVPDGNGGATCAFPNEDVYDAWDDVWALGIGPNGVSGVLEPTLVTRPAIVARPNPFSESVDLTYESALAQKGVPISFTVYDPSGRKVRELAPTRETPSGAATSWDGTDGSGATVPQGIYVVCAQAGKEGGAATGASCRIVFTR